jgi:hypothetical protein
MKEQSEKQEALTHRVRKYALPYHPISSIEWKWLVIDGIA